MQWLELGCGAAQTEGLPSYLQPSLRSACATAIVTAASMLKAATEAGV